MIPFIFVLFVFSVYSEGFVGSTVLLTDKGHIFIDQLTKDMNIQADAQKLQRVFDIQKVHSDTVVYIMMQDDCITCHPNQLFWCVNENRWIIAQELSSGDVFLTIDGQHMSIDEVQIVSQESELFVLTVDSPHHLYVGRHAVRAHNFAPVVGLTLAWAVGGGVEFLGATFFAGVAVMGTFVGIECAKNKNYKKPKMKPVIRPANDNPSVDSNTDKEKYPHGIYEDAPYHGKNKNGKKNPRPKNGQKALDQSIKISDNSDARISICDEEFVVLNRTDNTKYHGHVRTWEELDDDMRAVLQEAGLASKRGKIICN